MSTSAGGRISLEAVNLHKTGYCSPDSQVPNYNIRDCATTVGSGTHSQLVTCFTRGSPDKQCNDVPADAQHVYSRFEPKQMHFLACTLHWCVWNATWCCSAQPGLSLRELKGGYPRLQRIGISVYQYLHLHRVRVEPNTSQTIGYQHKVFIKL
jgi:hypothetical protein